MVLSFINMCILMIGLQPRCIASTDTEGDALSLSGAAIADYSYYDICGYGP